MIKLVAPFLCIAGIAAFLWLRDSDDPERRASDRPAPRTTGRESGDREDPTRPEADAPAALDRLAKTDPLFFLQPEARRLAGRNIDELVARATTDALVDAIGRGSHFALVLAGRKPEAEYRRILEQVAARASDDIIARFASILAASGVPDARHRLERLLGDPTHGSAAATGLLLSVQERASFARALDWFVKEGRADEEALEAIADRARSWEPGEMEIRPDLQAALPSLLELERDRRAHVALAAPEKRPELYADVYGILAFTQAPAARDVLEAAIREGRGPGVAAAELLRFGDPGARALRRVLVDAAGVPLARRLDALRGSMPAVRDVPGWFELAGAVADSAAAAPDRLQVLRTALETADYPDDLTFDWAAARREFARARLGRERDATVRKRLEQWLADERE